ncbi:MAG: hypothetical protein U1E59_02710 [Amaricoccus sp.]
MCRIAVINPAETSQPIRSAVIDLLAQAAPRPAALGAPNPDEQEFLDTLRRIVARAARDACAGQRAG